MLAPGPTNQKSVPGLTQRAVGTPPVTCSTSRPRAIDPLAWTTTPPWTAKVGTGWPLDEADAGRCAVGADEVGRGVAAGVV